MTRRRIAGRTGGEIIVDALVAHGIDAVFQLPGESFLPILDALHDRANTIRTITARHEAAAATMAEAYGKLTGRPGVCVVTRGPGASHASVAVHVAYQDSTPMILLVGQVERRVLGREAFQEIDVAAMFGWTAKWAGQIDAAAELPEALARAFHIAVSGRPGPVVLALPGDMLADVCDAPDVAPRAADAAAAQDNEVDRLFDLLGRAERPLVILGGSGWTEAARADLMRFAEANDLPACVTFRRQDRFDSAHANYTGDISYALEPALAERVRHADLILAIGTRLGEVATGGYRLLEVPVPAQTLIHVHPGADELGRVYTPTLAIAATVPAIAAALAGHKAVPGAPWAEWRRQMRAEFEATLAPAPCPGDLDMNTVMATVRGALRDDAIVTIDAGNFSQWVQRYYPYRRLHTQLAPCCGSMGYAIPAAIAAQVVHPERRAVAFVGDGGFLMTGSELATAVQHGLAPIVCVINNGMFGTIRMHQERAFPGRTMGTDLANPDFAAYARSFGAFGATVKRTQDFAPAFAEALAARKPAVLDLHLDPEALTTKTTLSALREKGLAER
jgi:acetolactate synthase-1/2/3 large subunit